MTFPPIKPGDLPWIMLIIAVCFLIGSILIFCGMTFSAALLADGESGGAAAVRYQQGVFDCVDGVHSGRFESGDDEHMNDGTHKRMCDEIRRIAGEIAEAAVEKRHPKTVE